MLDGKGDDMSDIVRGNRKGLFTFTLSDHGPDVCMSWETYKKLKDDATWGLAIYANLIRVALELERPASEENMETARKIVNESISRPIAAGGGFVDRRSDVIDAGGLDENE